MKKINIVIGLFFYLLTANAFAGPGDPFNGIDISLIDKSTGSAGVSFSNATMQLDLVAGTGTLDTSGFFFGGSEFIAHDMSVFTSPGAYTTSLYDFTVGADQIAAHILFDWGTSTDIEVLSIWDIADGGNSLLATDCDGDGVLGCTMLNGPFAGAFSMAINAPSAVPLPAAVWLFGTGLAMLFGFTRKQRK